MVSLIDALFIMPVALFAVAFIVPALILSTGAEEDFRHVTSLGMADTIAQNFALAFLQSEKNGASNLRQAAEVMSGRGRKMNWELLTDQPEMFSYLKVKFDSPVSSGSQAANDCSAGGFFSRKTSYGGPCDFYLKSFGAQEFDKTTRHFKIPIPVRGGRSGVMDLEYEVR